jgi:hypothetical protein
MGDESINMLTGIAEQKEAQRSKSIITRKRSSGA